MKQLTVAEIQALAGAIVATGDTFYCRRLLQRFERGEISFPDVMVLLENGGNSRQWQPSQTSTA